MAAPSTSAPGKRRYVSDPGILSARAALGGAIIKNLSAEEVAQRRIELEEAKVLAAAKKVAARLPELSQQGRIQVAALILKAAA